MQTWSWQTWNQLPYLTCNLLESWQHGFFTRQFSPRSPFDLTPKLYPDATVHRVKQVHGNLVLDASQLPTPLTMDNLPDGDGILSSQARQATWVCSADCTPALIGDRHTGHVAAVHAGWRGTAQQILPVAIERLLAQGARLEQIRVALGPAIAGSVYEVHVDVALQTVASVWPHYLELPQEHAIETLLDLDNSPILANQTAGKVRLDVRRVNVLQLESLGLQAEQIAIAPHCTYQDPDRFFSYRRDNQKQVQWSGIVSY